MPAGKDVRPGKWSNVLDLYDDGEYSAVWGNYDGNPKRCLGVRWNEGANPAIGYPSLFRHPQWYIEPDFATQGVLNALFNKVLEVPSLPRHAEYKVNIIKAQEELALQLAGNKIKKVIALCGAAACGKTPTLNRLIALIANAQGAKLIETEPPSADINEFSKDKKACFKFRGLTVGVATGGDDSGAIDNAFLFFNKFNCDVAFVATRKRADSSSCVTLWKQTEAGKIHLVYIQRTNAPLKDPAVETAINSKQAEELLSHIF